METIWTLMPIILTVVFVVSFIGLSILLHRDSGFIKILPIITVIAASVITGVVLVLIIIVE